MIIYKLNDTGLCKIKLNFSTDETIIDHHVRKQLKKGEHYRFIESVGTVNNKVIHRHVKLFFKDNEHYIEFFHKKFIRHFEKIKTPPPLTRHITNEVRLK